MRALLLSLLSLLVACTAAPPVTSPARPDAPSEPRPDASRQFTVWLGGERVGTAVETERWSPRGVELVRTETMQFLRGDAQVELVTTIVVSATPALEPTRVVWTERGVGERTAAAVRTAAGWVVTGATPGLPLPALAVPAELVPLIVARDGRFAAPVFLPARGFVAGRGRVDPVAPARLVARLAFAGGVQAEATIDTAVDGTYLRVVDGEGVIAMRATVAAAAESFPLVDLIAATAVPLRPSPQAPRGTITLLGDLALPEVPGQAAHASDAGLELALSPHLPGHLPAEVATRDRRAEIALLVSLVQRQITPDLGAGAGKAIDAVVATAGDCTTFALAYAAHARDRVIPTRLVTGLRIDGDQLVRHRWAVSWAGDAWIAVDAAFGAAPAGGDLIGLAVHDADDAGLIAGEAALMAVRGALRGSGAGHAPAAGPTRP